MDIVGYIGAILSGFLMGLMGGGGSIIIMPLLVSVFAITPLLSVTYSLFIVGVSSLFGTYSYTKQKNVDYNIAMLFGIPSLIGVYLTRSLIVPSLPSKITLFLDFQISKDTFIMSVLAVIIVLASYSMIRGNTKVIAERNNSIQSIIILIIQGFVVGCIASFVGISGGFLIIPTLVYFTNLRIQNAIGTALLIITVNCIGGFLTDIFTGIIIDWEFLTLLTLLSVFGVYIGIYFSNKIPTHKLKPIFGYFILVIGILILFQQIIK